MLVWDNIQQILTVHGHPVQDYIYITYVYELQNINKCKITNISESSGWIYAILDILESPCLALSTYQFIEGLVKYSWRYCASKIGYIVYYIVDYFLLHL